MAKFTNPIKNQNNSNEKLSNKINRRYILLAIFFILIMSILLLKLYDVQIQQHQRYIQQGYSASDTTQYQASTRGQIIDSKNNILVSNREHLSFIYLAPQSENDQSRLEKAEKFVEMFDVDLSTMTYRDRQDAYILLYPQEAGELLTEEQLIEYDRGKITAKQLYQLQLEQITDEYLSAHMTERDYKVGFTVLKMQSAKSLDIVLKDNVTPTQVNLLLENSDLFSGIRPYLNWEREMGKNHQIASVLGGITTNRQGLLKESALYNVALGYKLNDRIGKNGLELYYEQLLLGNRIRYDFNYDQNGNVTISEINSGQKGDILQLNLSLNFQSGVEEIVKNYLQAHMFDQYRDYMNSVYVVVSNPQTGAVMANVGIEIDRETQEVHYIPTGTYLNAFAVGSSVKGAMVYLFLDENVFSPGEIVIDEPIKIKGTEVKRSSAVLGAIDDLEALSKSSNVYMWKGVMSLGKANYEYDKAIDIASGTFEKVRSNFSQFGLGVNTGLDEPYESIGYHATTAQPGHLLDYVIGQLDTYTAMQLNQYVSTVANGKYRYRMHFVDKSYDSLSNTINFQNKPEILNALTNPDAINRVQQGFRLCVTDGYCRELQNAPFEVAAKTGTAETRIYLENDYVDAANSTAISYGPYSDPKVAVSCIVPNASHTDYAANPCLAITSSIYQLYYEQFMK